MFTDTTLHVSDVLSHIKRQFGDEAAVQITDSDIIRWVNAGQAEIFRRSEPIKSSMTADIVAGQATYSFPGDILRVQSLLYNGLPLKQLSYQEAEEYILDEDPNTTALGTGIIWYEWGGTFTIYPTPDSSSTGGLTIQYVRKPVVVEAATDLLSIPDAYYNRLIEYVLQQAYEMDENFQASELKGTQFTQNLESYTNPENTIGNTYPTITTLDEDL